MVKNSGKCEIEYPPPSPLETAHHTLCLDDISSYHIRSRQLFVRILRAEHNVDDAHLYAVSSDLLCAVDETSYEMRVGFIGSTHSLQYLFMYLCIYL